MSLEFAVFQLNTSHGKILSVFRSCDVIEISATALRKVNFDEGNTGLASLVTKILFGTSGEEFLQLVAKRAFATSG